MTMSKILPVRVVTASLVAILALSVASQAFPNAAWFGGVAHA